MKRNEQTDSPRSESLPESQEQTLEVGTPLPAFAMMTAEERRAHREKVAGEVMEKFLTSQEDDDAYTKQLKIRVAQKDFEETIGELLDLKSGSDIKQALEDLGISRSAKKTNKGEIEEQWRLKNPTAEGIPGSFVKEEHLKAFVVGFVGARSLRDKVEVLIQLYNYLGLVPPTIPNEVFVPPLVSLPPLPESPVLPSGERIPPVSPEHKPKPEEEKNGRRRPIPLPRWKDVLQRFGRATAPFAIGLISLFPMKDDGEDHREPQQIETVADTPSPRSKGDKEQGVKIEVKETHYYVMKKGDVIESICRDKLGVYGKDKELLREVVRQTLRDNDIGIIILLGCSKKALMKHGAESFYSITLVWP